MNYSQFHVPVLVDEVIQYLVHNRSGIYVDCTIGGGGHSVAILEAININGRLIGIDIDEEAIEFAEDRLTNFKNQITLRQDNFIRLADILKEERIVNVDGILLDLGVSSHQLDCPERGFSYLKKGPLDMRMGRRIERTAEHILHEYDENQLVRMIRNYGEEKFAKPIARAIIRERQKSNITNTIQLSNIISKIVPVKHRIKSFTRVFQAIRIELNHELINLREVLRQSIAILRKKGRLVVISYHSLEDRIVKEFMKNQENPCDCPRDFPECVCHKKPMIKTLTRRVIKPCLKEIESNPRSRSAHLRVVEKIV